MPEPRSRLKGPPVPAGDYGIGLCAGCLVELREWMVKQPAGGSMDGAPVPQFAITLAAQPMPIPGPGGRIMGVALVAIPTCFGHLFGGQEMSDRQGSGLLIS